MIEKCGNLNKGKTLCSKSDTLGFFCQDFFLCIYIHICVDGNEIKLSLVFCRLHFPIYNKAQGTFCLSKQISIMSFNGYVVFHWIDGP